MKFINSNLVFQLVEQAVVKGLGKVDFPRYAPDENLEAHLDRSAGSYSRSSSTADELIRDHDPILRQPADFRASRYELSSFDQKQIVGTETWKTETAPVKLFQLHHLFMIEEVSDGIMVYDQHAVHERVLYENFIKQILEKKELATQRLLVPFEMELAPVEAETLRHARETLNSLGFDIKIENQTLKVTQIPVDLSGQNLSELFKEYLNDLATAEMETSPIKEINDQTHREIAYLACRSAVKAGDKLHQVELQKLLQDYRSTKMNQTCPHGRPVQVHITMSEMDKWFKR